MRALSSGLRAELERAVLVGRRAAEDGVRAALSVLGVAEPSKPSHLDDGQARLRRGLRAKQRQLGGDFEVLVWECAYEQWHRLLFARFLAENGLLRHPEYGAPVTLADCEELADDLDEPDGWSVAGRFAAEILPGIFRLEDPCFRLRLAPEHRVKLEGIVAGLDDEVFLADDSLGWVYQYWQSERKDEVNASEEKVGGADLGPVTQLFTENYMVRFLLENSLGAWWAARHPDSDLIDGFEFLRFDEAGQPAAGRFEGWPDSVGEVTVMDPCCGSGHFLVEAFGMLWQMRAEEEGLEPVEAQNAVLRDNLFGLELDPRCVQIAMFAVALTAWKQGGGWRQLPTPHIACSGIPAKTPLEEWTGLAEGDERLESALERLHTLFKDADTLGSLIDPRRAAEMANAAGTQRSLDDVDFEEVAPLLEKAAERETDDPATGVLGADAAGIARAATLLSEQYCLVTTNPPYLGRNKQVEVLREFATVRFPLADKDLATMFVSRCLSFLPPGGVSATVSSQNWLFLSSFRDLRVELLERTRFLIAAQLGEGAFGSAELYSFPSCLFVLENSEPAAKDVFSALDVRESQDPADKAVSLQGCDQLLVTQSTQLQVPGQRIVFRNWDADQTLDSVARPIEGLSTGDNARYQRSHWEIPPSGRWTRFQRGPNSSGKLDGCSDVVLWESGKGSLAASDQARIQGQEAWGDPGVLIGRVGEIRATQYLGGLYDKSSVVLSLEDESLLPAVFAYTTSDEYAEDVRAIDQKLGAATSATAAVPFDAERWRQVAEERYSGGLPEPWSDDPKQWLFEGRPEVSTEPLQVAVGRLLGYGWPEQPESDDLDEFADADGIVCLPPVGGELPAADRLQGLLARAFGGGWGPGVVRRLLEDAGSKRETLNEWLYWDFFGDHCSVFSNRPFVWHISDGRSDGFSALVNYHRLDKANLEKLTYTYLGDWIERQRADAADEILGADTRLGAAQELQKKLEAILAGEPPFDIYVRWKDLHEQPIGWDPDLDDGVRLNVRPFVEAEVLRRKFSIHWKKDRGKNPDGSLRHNDLHYTNEEKRQARQQAGVA